MAEIHELHHKKHLGKNLVTKFPQNIKIKANMHIVKQFLGNLMLIKNNGIFCRLNAYFIIFYKIIEDIHAQKLFKFQNVLANKSAKICNFD